MSPSIQGFVPQEWQGAFEVLSAPVAWIPSWHTSMINVAWYGDSSGEVFIKRLLILLPMLLLLTAVWSTGLSLYALPFRSNRRRFLSALVSSWWDAGRSTWFFWAGIVRVAMLLVGWTWGILRLATRLVVAGVNGTFRSPFVLLDWTSRNYFKPGVPWVAFLALLVWSAVEALVFMYTLQPTLTEVLAGITGLEPDPRFLAPLLWVFLCFLILGSFACVHALAEAVRARRIAEIVQMSLVELFVMFFEVIFLYRELIDAVTPWIALQTGGQVQLGLVSTLLLASFGWVGVRGMTWFLFGRYGTPAVLAVLARETIKQKKGVPEVPEPPQVQLWQVPIAAFKAESKWFRSEAEHAFELLSLPVLQLFAAAVNFVMVPIAARPMFSLPFKTIEDVLHATPRPFQSKESMGSAHVSSEPQLQGGTQ